MGYTRIEYLAGGAARLAMPTLNAGAIDKVTDARGEHVRTQRADSEGVNRLSPSKPNSVKEQRVSYATRRGRRNRKAATRCA